MTKDGGFLPSRSGIVETEGKEKGVRRMRNSTW